MTQSQPIKAAVWMFGAMVSFSLMAIAGRSLAGHLDTFEIMLYRSLIGLIIVGGVAYFAGTLSQINTSALGLHLIRNIAHFTGQNLWFYAVAFIPLSQLFAFEFSTPLWVAILAPFFLGERMTIIRFLAAALGFIGILIVARPDMTSISPPIIAAALCAIGFAGAVMATKLLSRTQTITCILFWLVFMQAIFGLICAGYDGNITIPGTTAAFWVTIVGFCGIAAHFCITTALTLAPATVVAPLEFLRLPLISVIAYFLYQESLEWAVLIGAVLVFAANILNILAERESVKRGKISETPV